MSKYLKNLSSLLLPLLLASCSHGQVPKWDGKIYAGDSKNEAISRNNPHQPAETLKCALPEFDQYVCMSGEDFKEFALTYVYGCQKWKGDPPAMRPELLWIMVKP